MSEEKQELAKFSLPYREGMELEAGYVDTYLASYKTYQSEPKDEKGLSRFVHFAFSVDDSIIIDDKKALEHGRKVLRRNATAVVQLAIVGKKYGIATAGTSKGATALTDNDKESLKGFFELSTNYKKIQVCVQKHPKMGAFAKTLTAEELKVLAEGELKPDAV
jgi:hypothetical protein